LIIAKLFLNTVAIQQFRVVCTGTERGRENDGGNRLLAHIRVFDVVAGELYYGNGA